MSKRRSDNEALAEEGIPIDAVMLAQKFGTEHVRARDKSGKVIKFKDAEDKKPHKHRGKDSRQGQGSEREPKILSEEREVVITMKTNDDQRETRNQGGAPSPFVIALEAARKITTRQPRDEQPEELKQLLSALAQLDERGNRSLVFRLQKDYFEDRGLLQTLFPVARHAKMMAVAYSAGPVKKVIQQISFDDLQNSGLVEIRDGREGKNYTHYNTGHQSLAEAAKKLRENDQSNAAQILEEHLRENERNRALRQASRKTDQVKTAEPKAETSPAAEAEALAEEPAPAVEEKTTKNTKAGKPAAKVEKPKATK